MIPAVLVFMCILSLLGTSTLHQPDTRAEKDEAQNGEHPGALRSDVLAEDAKQPDYQADSTRKHDYDP